MPKRKAAPKSKQIPNPKQNTPITVSQIETDHITEVRSTRKTINFIRISIKTSNVSICLQKFQFQFQLANKFWSLERSPKDLLAYDASVVEKVYNIEILGDSRRVLMLEFSRYLENYLWPNFSPDASDSHVMSIVFLLNEKFRERIEVWKVFENKPENFPILFNRVLQKCLEKIDIVKATPSVIREQTSLLIYLNHCFNSMEEELCRDQARKLVSLSIWSCLLPKRREQELNAIPEWKKFWKKLQKRDKPEMKEKLEWERHFLQVWSRNFLEFKFFRLF